MGGGGSPLKPHSPSCYTRNRVLVGYGYAYGYDPFVGVGVRAPNRLTKLRDISVKSLTWKDRDGPPAFGLHRE